MDFSQVGKAIRTARRAKDWTQGELARRSGFSLGSICNIEKGKMTPSFASLTTILQALGLKASIVVEVAIEQPVAVNDLHGTEGNG